MVDAWDFMEGMADVIMGSVNPIARTVSKPMTLAIIAGIILIVFAVFILLPGVRYATYSLVRLLYGG